MDTTQIETQFDELRQAYLEDGAQLAALRESDRLAAERLADMQREADRLEATRRELAEYFRQVTPEKANAIRAAYIRRQRIKTAATFAAIAVIVPFVLSMIGR